MRRTSRLMVLGLALVALAAGSVLSVQALAATPIAPAGRARPTTTTASTTTTTTAPPPAIANYTDTSMASPIDIVAGSDGALWFTNYGNKSIGRIATDGAITNFTGTGISGPDGITAGPDGALWFTNPGNDSIGRITTDGTVTNYTDSMHQRPAGHRRGS